jgi:hypothetical protein
MSLLLMQQKNYCLSDIVVAGEGGGVGTVRLPRLPLQRQ